MSIFQHLFETKDSANGMFNSANPYCTQQAQAQQVDAPGELVDKPRKGKKRDRLQPTQQEDQTHSAVPTDTRKQPQKLRRGSVKTQADPPAKEEPPVALHHPATSKKKRKSTPKVADVTQDVLKADQTAVEEPPAVPNHPATSKKQRKRAPKATQDAGKAGKISLDTGEVPQAASGEAEIDAKNADEATTSERDSGEEGGEEPQGSDKNTPEELSRTVFVGNVSADGGQSKTRSRLKALFSEYGTVEAVRLRCVAVDVESKMPKVHQIKAGKIDSARAKATAFLRFSDATAAAAALSKNMAVFQGCHLRVDAAAAPSSKEGKVLYTPNRSVFVGNLPFDCQEDELIELFNSGAVEPQLRGAVEAVRVVKDKKSRIGKGFAYVLLKSHTAALAALNLHGTAFKTRTLRVLRVQGGAGGTNGSKVKGGSGKSVSSDKAGNKSGPGKRIAQDFGGFKTKGKGKAASKPARASAGVVKSTSRVGTASGNKSKRPAVLARKAKQLLALGRVSDADVQAVLRKTKKGQAQTAKKSIRPGR